MQANNDLFAACTNDNLLVSVHCETKKLGCIYTVAKCQGQMSTNSCWIIYSFTMNSYQQVIVCPCWHLADSRGLSMLTLHRHSVDLLADFDNGADSHCILTICWHPWWNPIAGRLSGPIISPLQLTHSLSPTLSLSLAVVATFLIDQLIGYVCVWSLCVTHKQQQQPPTNHIINKSYYMQIYRHYKYMTKYIHEDVLKSIKLYM